MLCPVCGAVGGIGVLHGRSVVDRESLYIQIDHVKSVYDAVVEEILPGKEVDSRAEDAVVR